MLSTPLPSPLREPAQGLAAASTLVAHLDDALMAGFARLGPSHRDALDRVAAALAGSPLGGVVREAVAAARVGPPTEAHLIALAAGREALQGAMHDALLAQALALTGRPADIPSPATRITTLGGDPSALVAARQWLVELALGGLASAEPASVLPFGANLERLQEDRSLARLSALLTGLFDELSDLLPLASADEAPARRWADLWSRALLECVGRAELAESTVEKGRFSCFAMDVRHHAHVVSVALWGLWLPDGAEPRVARATLSGWRVPAIAGPESWHALKGAFGPLLQAVAEGRAWDASATVYSSGDLRLQGGAAGPALDPFAVAALAMAAPLPVPVGADRHPVQLGVPLLFEVPPQGKDASSVPFGDGALPISYTRTSEVQNISPAALAPCARWIGLLRWDDGAWSVSPLAGQNRAGKKPVHVGPLDGLAAELKGTSEALSILRERAGKLLRVKS